MPHSQLRKVGQLLDADDGVVQRRLERLCHGVGQDHRDHHGQDVRDLTGQLEDDDRGGHGVCDGAGKCRSTCARGGEKTTLNCKMSAKEN